MDIIFLLIPIAMMLVVFMAVVYLWSVKSGQMDDLEGPAFRILMDDDSVKTIPLKDQETKKKIDL